MWHSGTHGPQRKQIPSIGYWQGDSEVSKLHVSVFLLQAPRIPVRMFFFKKLVESLCRGCRAMGQQLALKHTNTG